ncbi:MAG: hypothetical protein JW959_06280 [Pirellulales bacterium]|nr:hypothetical protein [Pirellulales bacterium]
MAKNALVPFAVAQDPRIMVDQQMIQANAEMLTKIADLVKKSWDEQAAPS